MPIETARAHAAQLRRQAEQQVAAQMGPDLAQTPAETAHLLHELQVHQIELELQNEELRQTQAALDAARARYFDLYDLAPVGYCTLNAQGLILEANLTLATRLGVARGALIQWPLARFICPDDQARYYQCHLQLRQTGAPQTEALRLVQGDGTLCWAQLVATAAPDPASSSGPAAADVPVIRVVLSDITARKQAEAALLELNATLEQRVAARTAQLTAANAALRAEVIARTQAEQALQVQRDFATQIINTMGQGLTVTDAAGCFELVNPAYARFFGYTAAELLGKRPQDVTPPEDHATLAQQSAARHAGQTTTYETQLRRADGSAAHVLITAAPRAPTGPYAGAIAVITDLTERHQLETALQESEERLRAILAALTEGIILQDADGAISFSNASAERILGLTTAQLLGRLSIDPHWRALREDGTPFSGETHPAMVTLRTGQALADVILGIHKPDGTLTWLSINAQPLHRPGVSQPYAVVTSFADITAARAAAAALRAQEALYHAMFEGNQALQLLLDPATGALVAANPAACAFYGYAPADMLRLRIQDINTAPPAQVLDQAGAAAARAQSHFFFQHRLASGAVREVEVHSSPIVVQGRTLLYSIIHDITARKQAEAALQESEARFRRLAENAPDVIYRLRLAPEPRLEFISPAVMALTGYPPEAFYADLRVALTLIHPDDLRFVQAALTGQVTLTPAAETLRLTARDGTRRWVEQRAVLLHDAAGQLSAIEGIVRDITERKAHEAAMQLRAQLLDAAADSMFLLDLQGQIRYANQAAWLSRGYTSEELLQLNIRDLDAVEEQAESTPRIARIRQAGTSRFEAQHRRKDGAIFPVEVRAQLIAVHDESMILAAVTDVTQQQQAQAEIGRALAQERELNDLKSQFIATTSHEFRTPLSTILTSAELIEHYGARWPAEKQLYYLRLIQRCCLQMTELLNDILTLERAAAGQLTCHPAPLELVAFCQHLVEEVQLTASAQHVVTFACACAEVCPSACLDEKLLRQILANLLSNALKYSPAGGAVRLELACSPTQVEFRVQDHGLGIPPEAQAQLFDLFYRAANVGAIRGTGLGLAIVKRAVDAHGGTIQYTSAVGVGSTFVVTLPRVAA